MDSKWWAISEAPQYLMNDEGHVRYRRTGRCLKHRNDGLSDDPYVVLRIDGRNVRRSVSFLLKTMQMTRRR